MPELPEVETTLRGIKPRIYQQKVTDVIVRHPHLRWPIPKDLKAKIKGKIVKNCERRGKYLLLTFDTGTLILHLGMSGRLGILTKESAPKKHDHVDIYFDNVVCLRFTDPRRFGAVLWTQNPSEHPLLKAIGPEPLTDNFNAEYLLKRAKNRKISIKSFIMDSKIVAGVGNIYATEALFLAGIHPLQSAGALDLKQYQKLVKAIKKVLNHAIKKGGTTLKDFMKADGLPGYFSISLNVYGRSDQPCLYCRTPLKSLRIGQRATVFCPACQR